MSLFVISYFIIVKSCSSSCHRKLQRSPFQGVVKVSRKDTKAKYNFFLFKDYMRNVNMTEWIWPKSVNMTKKFNPTNINLRTWPKIKYFLLYSHVKDHIALMICLFISYFGQIHSNFGQVQWLMFVQVNLWSCLNVKFPWCEFVFVKF